MLLARYKHKGHARRYSKAIGARKAAPRWATKAEKKAWERRIAAAARQAGQQQPQQQAADPGSPLAQGQEEEAMGGEGGPAVGETGPSPLWELLQPAERKLLYLSPDGREVHYAAAAKRRRDPYHHNFRDFVVVGFRSVKCSDGDVPVGWCSSARGCDEDPGRRDCYSEADMSLVTKAEVLPPGCAAHCKCSQRVLDDLNGKLGFVMHHEDRSPGRGDGMLVDEWMVAGARYTTVNLNAPHEAVFKQWGVTKSTADGRYQCHTCVGTPRHCRHNQALLDVEHDAATHEVDVEGKIKDALACDGLLELPCISKEKLPFFPDDDVEVMKHYEARVFAGGVVRLPVQLYLGRPHAYYSYWRDVVSRDANGVWMDADRWFNKTLKAFTLAVKGFIMLHYMDYVAAFACQCEGGFPTHVQADATSVGWRKAWARLHRSCSPCARFAAARVEVSGPCVYQRL
eukprot:jgi/Tetstr1/436608/TSEL_025404.t1